MKIVNDTVVANASTPSRWLPLQSHNIATEGICLHRLQGAANASLIAERKFSEVFLSWSGEQESPHGEGIRLMIPHHHGDRQPDRDATQRVQPS
ncbi:MAG TPA: hypothetical protein VHA33_05255 [Candidatus Angelobacter sp.]|nr:hypothetical protein [Candidatus Angelobacter sp.]